jgi:outer membrane protein assembly factor BamA
MKNKVQLFYRVLVFLVILFIFYSYSYSQVKVNKVIVDNNDNISTKFLSAILLDKNGTTYDSTLLQIKIDSIKQTLFKEGIVFSDYNVYLTNTKNNQFDLHVKFDSLKYLYFSQIEIEGDTNKTSKSLIKKVENTIYSEKKLLDLIDELLSNYENSGYPFVEIVIKNITPSLIHDKLNITLHVDKGEIFNINSFKITGNKITRESTILKQSSISKGDVYNKLIVDNIPTRLMRLDIFESVEKPELFLNFEGGVLSINFKEAKALSFDGMVGYIPSESDDKSGEVTGLVNIFFRNMFGTARKLAIVWQKESSKNQTINIKYTEPFLFSLPFKMGVDYFQREYDTLYVQRNVKLSNTFDLYSDIQASLLLQYEKITPGSESIYSQYIKSNSYSLGLEFLFDSRDNIRDTRSGALVRSSVIWGNKKYSTGEQGSKNVNKINVNSDIYNSFFKNQVFFNSLNSIFVICSRLDQSDLIYFGGINSIRGYRENQFSASSVIWLNNEYRIAFQDATYIYPFFDIGYYKVDTVINVTEGMEDFLYSYGIGFTVATEIGIIRLNFSLGRYDKFSDMKIHFAYRNYF